MSAIPAARARSGGLGLESGFHALRHDLRRDPPRVHRLLRGARASGRAVGFARAVRARSVGAADDRRHAAVQAVLPRPGRAPESASDDDPALLPRRRHRRRRLDRAAHDVLPDDGQLLVRRLLQAGCGGDGLRALDRALRPRSRAHLGDRLRGRRAARTRTTSPATSGSARASRRAASSSSARTTSGRRGRRGRAGRARSSTTTAGSSAAAAAPTASPAATATASSSSGTSCSWSSTAAATAR